VSQRYLVVAAKFNDLITKALLEGAKEAFQESGIASSDVDVVWVPGAFEIPTVAAKAARSHAFQGIVCLGAVIRGETPHFDYVAGQAAAGCQQVGIETGVPVIFGVLTTDTVEQALSRCGIKSGNKGAEAAKAAIQTAKALAKVEELARR
jgi:6,7-dimethyl-8-ribityllumazine synthase